jgi:3-oxoacyl-[acyl-carrier protein] reductase
MARVDFWNTDPREWDRYMRVNLYGVLHCTRACVGGMVKQGFGRVISIISDAGRTGEQGHEAYSAAKAGTAGFSRALARAVGRYGVTANTISLSNIKREVSGENTISPEAVEMMLKRYIIRRQGLPRDVAAMVLFLASNESSWITGQNYPVNGGFSLSL